MHTNELNGELFQWLEIFCWLRPSRLKLFKELPELMT